MKKKIMLILMAGTLIFSLTACGSSEETGNDKASNEVESSEQKVAETPTKAPTAEPTQAPTAEPTEAPTSKPTEVPMPEPTETPVPETVVLCYYEEIEPVAVLTKTDGAAYYDPNFMYENCLAGYEDQSRIDWFEENGYLMQGGGYCEGEERVFTMKTVYRDVEYYAYVSGFDGKTIMIVPVADFEYVGVGATPEPTTTPTSTRNPDSALTEDWEALEVLCFYEKIEPVTVMSKVEGTLFFDPNSIYLSVMAGEMSPHIAEGCKNDGYLSASEIYAPGETRVFDMKTTYLDVEYYSCVVNYGTEERPMYFRMIAPMADFEIVN